MPTVLKEITVTYVGWCTGRLYFRGSTHELIPVPAGFSHNINSCTEPGVEVTLCFTKFETGSWYVVKGSK